MLSSRVSVDHSAMSFPISKPDQSDQVSQSSDLKSPSDSEKNLRLPRASIQSQSRASIINAAVAARKRGNLSHLSESDHRSEISYKSEPSGAISDPSRSSKFKLVKLGDKTPYVRGRFTCFDFHDLPVKDVVPDGATARDSPRIATPIQQLPDVTTGGTWIFSPTGSEPLTPQSDSVIHNLRYSAAIPVGMIQKTGTLVQSPLLFVKPSKIASISRSPSQLASPSAAPTPAISPEPTSATALVFPAPLEHPSVAELSQKRQSVPMPEMIARHSPVPSGSATPSRKVSVISGPDPSRLLKMKGEAVFAEMIDRVWETSATGKGGFDKIEGKIQQCMSLVTEHVLLAVRADLDELKEKAKLLKDRTNSLEYENHALRIENVLLRNAVNNPPSTSASNTTDIARISRMK